MDKHLCWKFLKEEYDEDKNLFGGPVKDHEIKKAEETIGLEFHEPYKKFLKLYGGGELGGNYLYGLKESYYMSPDQDVIKRTHFFKKEQQWPEIDDWYIISDDGFGNPIGIDPQGVVWLSDHDSGFEKIKLADDFEEFLYKLHTNTLYE